MVSNALIISIFMEYDYHDALAVVSNALIISTFMDYDYHDPLAMVSKIN